VPSNLRLKSNVYIRRTEGSLCNDADFIRHVRGLPAVRKLLGLLGVTAAESRYDSEAVRNLLRRGLITVQQHNSLKWGLKCLTCDSLPVGLTFDGRLESRCETPGCALGATQAKRLLLPDSVVMDFRDDLRAEETLTAAIEECRGVPPSTPPYDGPRTLVIVRIDATIAWTYSSDELSAFLLYGLIKRNR
jgi:hypothetical protein